MGDWLAAGENQPTTLIYAHYDVQPVDPLELWESPPFEPRLNEGKLYARGAIDDKCNAWINLKAFEAMLNADGKLPVNVKVIFEGEEESGSPNMEAFVTQHKERLKADVLLIGDGGGFPNQPLLLYALRGGASAEVVVSGPSHDLHSGSYGGVIHNPIHQVGRIIGALHDESGRVQIPGFYEPVRSLTPSDLALIIEYGHKRVNVRRTRVAPSDEASASHVKKIN